MAAAAGATVYPRTGHDILQTARAHLALYGTLVAGGLRRVGGGVEDALVFVGPCRIPGRLFDLGPYPGLVASDPLPGGGSVAGELYAVRDDAVLRRLDAFEDYRPDDPEGSEYLRRRVRLAEPDLEAWVYLYNRDVTGMPRVESGDWRHHRASRGAARAG